MSKPKSDVGKRFWSKVRKRGPEQCWPWKASLTVAGGYGQFGCTYEWLGIEHPGWTMVTAHRIAWILTNGPIPEGLDVLHKCDNPPCCNPDHLFTGTQGDNVEDMIQKGRHGHGTTGGPRKYNELFLAAIIAEYVETPASVEKLSRKYGVAPTHLRRLIKRAGVPVKRVFRRIDLDQAAEIRKLYATGDYTYFDLEARFGVSFSMIGCIVRNENLV